MLKLESIAAFTAIAASGSFSAAARELALSNSVISERLAELERTLGAKLVSAHDATRTRSPATGSRSMSPPRASASK